MPKGSEPPRLDNRFVCIVDRDAVALAAVISSYLFETGSYLPVFLFPSVRVGKVVNATFMSEGYAANLMASPADILINNALARMGGCEHLILAGLSDAQKSFLTLPRQSNVIEIADLSDVPVGLSSVAPARRELRCRAIDILNGLVVAQRRQRRLLIDEGARDVPEVVNLEEAMIVVEKTDDASPVLAVNYASAMGASVLIVDSFTRAEARSIQRWIQAWKTRDDRRQFEKLEAAVRARIGGISFAQFKYATFFTEGLPYSLVLENIIPCSHVHLSLKPDHFIFNSIMFKGGSNFHAAVVFSPVFFSDEETKSLCDLFTKKNYYVRALIGADATLANLDFHAQHFPYDLLHLCSHGGEVEGYEMSERFVDQDGNQHLVEFEEVVGHTPVLDDPGMVAVHRKVFLRRLDGLEWMSTELEERNLPSHVYLDTWKYALQSKGQRSRKGRIEMSCAIACVDSIHQGEFYTLASHTSPLIFNNTCWSSHEVAAFFLACGSRGYIGTLWAIDNQAAIVAAHAFYENLFSGSILDAFHAAVKAIEHTTSKDIYVYWGLHFTAISPAPNAEQSYSRVRRGLMRAAVAWVRKIESAEDDEIRRNSTRVLESVLSELATKFDSAEVRLLEATIRQRMPKRSQTRGPEVGKPSAPAASALGGPSY
jgi:hypothetical protein